MICAHPPVVAATISISFYKSAVPAQHINAQIVEPTDTETAKIKE